MTTVRYITSDLYYHNIGNIVIILHYYSFIIINRKFPRRHRPLGYKYYLHRELISNGIEITIISVHVYRSYL